MSDDVKHPEEHPDEPRRVLSYESQSARPLITRDRIVTALWIVAGLGVPVVWFGISLNPLYAVEGLLLSIFGVAMMFCAAIAVNLSPNPTFRDVARHRNNAAEWIMWVCLLPAFAVVWVIERAKGRKP